MVDIRSIEVSAAEDHSLVSAYISVNQTEGEAWYKLPPSIEVDVEGAADAFFCVGLVIAMGTGTPLTIDVPISRKLLHSTRAIEGVLREWYPKRVKPLTFTAEARPADKPAIQTATVSCFTGGVDSFDTFLTNLDDIDSLVYVHGYDVSLKNLPVRNATSENLRQVAESTGKELIEVETNIRKFINKAGTWSVLTHGSALASVGHLLSGNFGRLLVPATHSYEDKYAWGSHPLLDHLWSTYRLDVVHDGAEKSRVDKTKVLANDSNAQGHLRVCWQNTGKYNCGECSKCLRTMIALHLAGVLGDFRTFDNEIPWDKVRALEVTNRSGRSFMMENVAFAKEQGDGDVVKILSKLVEDFDASKRSKQSQTAAADVRSDEQAQELKALAARVTRIEKMWPTRAWRKVSSVVHRRR